MWQLLMHPSVCTDIIMCQAEEGGRLALLGPWEAVRRIYSGSRPCEALVAMRTKQRRQVCVLLPNKQHLDCAVTVSDHRAFL